MNTFCAVEAEGESAEDAVEAAFSELQRIENKFSKYRPDSEIYRLNQDASRVTTDSEVSELLSRCQEFSRMSRGAFDISVGGAQIDLGAVAKGYSLDKAVEILRGMGVTEAQINLGGNIYILNDKPQKIAIRNPVSPDDIATFVWLSNTSISTSADYERPGHILDPKTRCPARTDVLSASVVSEDAAMADALSTAAYILGVEKAKEMLGQVPGVEAVIISKGRGPSPVQIDLVARDKFFKKQKI